MKDFIIGSIAIIIVLACIAVVTMFIIFVAKIQAAHCGAGEVLIMRENVCVVGHK